MSNTCERCGGVETVYYEVVFIPGKRAVLAQHQSSIMKLCMCPIERPKHDGKLGTRYEVQYYADRVSITGDMQTNDTRDSVWLDPHAALSLLAWLRQEESALEALAKEKAP